MQELHTRIISFLRHSPTKALPGGEPRKYIYILYTSIYIYQSPFSMHEVFRTLVSPCIRSSMPFNGRCCCYCCCSYVNPFVWTSHSKIMGCLSPKRGCCFCPRRVKLIAEKNQGRGHRTGRLQRTWVCTHTHYYSVLRKKSCTLLCCTTHASTYVKYK